MSGARQGNEGNSPRSAIVLVVDRLGASSLGPYGNTWLDTPNFNALAAQGWLMETMLAERPELAAAYRSYWASDADTASLPAALAASNVTTTLITDEQAVAALPEAASFADQSILQFDAPTACAAQIDQSELFQLFAAALTALEQQRSPFLLWIHARGLAAAWDAPLEFRQSLAGEDDPLPPDTIEVPSLRLPVNYDPDKRLGITQASAGQVMLLDTCLGMLMSAIEQHPSSQQLLTMVTSPRGFPLGEHHIIGDFEPVLHGELLHVPCLIARGDGREALSRFQQLSHTADVAATLLDWFDLPMKNDNEQAASLLNLPHGAPARPRDRALSFTNGQRSIRTPAWFLREQAWDESHPIGETPRELFRKPDDRWEVNELARRCPQIVEMLVAAMDEMEQALQDGSLERLSELPVELIEGLD